MADGTLKFRKKNPNWRRDRSRNARSKVVRPRPRDDLDIFIRNLEKKAGM